MTGPRSRLACAVGAALALFHASADARAAKLPEWAQEIAASAPPVEVVARSEAWRTLFREVVYDVAEDGTIALRFRTAQQALSGLVEVNAETMISNHDREITRVRAWHLAPGDKRAKRRGRTSTMDVAVGNAFVSDQNAKLIYVEGIERGSLVFFEFEAEETPLSYTFIESVPRMVDTTLALIRFELPDAWTLDALWMRGDGPDATREGSTWTWRLEALPRIESEPLSERPTPRLLVRLSAPDPGIRPGAFHADWNEFASWYRGLAEGLETPNESLVSIAAESVQGAQGFGERVIASSTWTRDSVRYVSKALGIGAIKARPATETLETRWGDCKDKSTLLTSMLATQGIKAYPVLVHLSLDDTVSESLPAIGSFNHMIVGIPFPEGEEVPERLSRATLNVEGIGPLLFVDTTDEYTAVGALSSGLAGKRALIVTDSAGVLVELPGTEPSAHGIEISVSAELVEGGDARFALEARCLGAPAGRVRAAYRSSLDDRRAHWQELIADTWPGARLDAFDVVEEDPDGAVVEKITFDLPKAGGLRISLFPSATNWLPKVSVSDRELPVAYGYPREISYRTRVEGALAGQSLSADMQRSFEGLSIEAVTTLNGETAEATARLVLSKTEFEKSEFRTLRRAYAAMRSLGGRAIQLR